MGGEEKSPKALAGETDLPDVLEESVRRFLHQTGAPFEKIGEIAERAIREALAGQRDEADPTILLFRIAAGMIEGDPGGEQRVHLFRFEEDELLHQQILGLPSRVRLPFVLMNLHDFNPEEAGLICRMTVNETLKAAEKGSRMLAEAAPNRDLARQLGLIRRAYSRIQYPKPVSEQPETSDLGKQVTDGPQGKRLWTAGAGLLAAVGLLIAAAFIFPSWTAPVDAAYIKKLELQFDEEKARFQEKVGATDMEMQGFFTIDEAQYEFKSLISEFKRDIEDGNAPKKKEVELAVGEQMSVFGLPSEMITDLRDRPLTDDKAGSRTFLQRFRNRKHELTMIFATRFMEHQDILKDAVKEDKFDAETFFGNAGGYPKTLRHAVRLMEKEGFGLSGGVWVTDDQVYPLPGKIPELGEDSQKLEESVARLAVLEETLEPALYSLELSPETIAEALAGLEQLAADRDDGDQWTLPEELAVNYFREFVFGGSTGRVFGDDGTVVPKRRAIWRQIALNAGTPSGKLMDPVVREMEQTGWKRSASYNVLTPEEYQYALMSARDGVEREPEHEVFQSAFLPDSEYMVRAETLYRDLSEGGDRSLLEGEPQVMIVLVALLAADRQDEPMMAMLSAEGNPDAVAMLAEKGTTRVLEGGSVDYQNSAIEHHETGIRAPVYVYFGPTNEHKIWLTYTPDGLWLIDHQDTQ